MHRLLGAIATLVLLPSLVLVARGDGQHCDRCGCESGCQKVCRVVEVPTKEVCYDCKCEDICVPGPSKCCGKSCQQTCDGKYVKVQNWIPQCGTVRTKRTLVKKEVESCKKNYKWVVEYVCPRCAADGGSAPRQAQADVEVIANPDAAPILMPSEMSAPRVTKASFFATLMQAHGR